MALGFIIFGWPKRTKSYGPTIPEYCDHCDNESYFSLFKSRRWFSLFFIPFLPLGFAKRYLLCNVCQAGFELDQSEWKRLKEFTSVTKAFHDGNLSEDEYLEAYDNVATELWGEFPSELEDGTPQSDGPTETMG